MNRLHVSLDRPLAFIDTETTGLNPSRCRIVELALVRVDPDGSVLERVRRFYPEEPIPAEATAVHGITDEDVADEPPFRRRARSLADVLEPCDLAGFNIRRYDLPLLLAEFRRSGMSFDVGRRRIIDIQQIFHREEPRDLSAAARFYLGHDLEGAHSALSDTRTTVSVFAAQLERYANLPRTVEGLHDYCDAVAPFRREVDRWFERDTDGVLVFRRGKHGGRALHEIAQSESDYLHWMVGAEEMDPEVIDLVQRALRGELADPAQSRLELPQSDDGTVEPFA